MSSVSQGAVAALAASVEASPAPRFAVVRRTQLAAERTLRHLLHFRQMRSRYVATTYGRVHVYDTRPDSDEVPAMLVHGLGGSSASLLPVATRLLRHRRVVLPDLLHFSPLSEPRDRWLTSGQHVRVLVELIAKISPGPVDYVGHSVGGGAGIHLATSHGAYVRSLALINPGGFRLGLERVLDDILRIDARRAHDVFAACVSARARPRLLRRVGVRILHELLASPGVRDYLRTLHDVDCVDDKLGDIRCPTLLLWGDEDRLLPEGIALALARHVAQVEAYWIRGCSHLLPLEAPKTVASLLTRFWGQPASRPSVLQRVAETLRPEPTWSPIPREEALCGSRADVPD